jgi:hypothetical protein
MPAAHHIRWGRVVLGGVFIELTMLGIIVPVNAISEPTAYYLVPILALATAWVFGYWAARPVQSHFVLHGVLAAAVASLIYVVLTTAAGVPVPLLFHLSHGVRLVGGAVGGAYAARQAISTRVRVV